VGHINTALLMYVVFIMIFVVIYQVICIAHRGAVVQ
jgi:hypothetical protein